MVVSPVLLANPPPFENRTRTLFLLWKNNDQEEQIFGKLPSSKDTQFFCKLCTQNWEDAHCLYTFPTHWIRGGNMRTLLFVSGASPLVHWSLTSTASPRVATSGPTWCNTWPAPAPVVLTSMVGTVPAVCCHGQMGRSCLLGFNHFTTEHAEWTINYREFIMPVLEICRSLFLFLFLNRDDSNWVVVWNMNFMTFQYFPILIGVMSSSQLTNA